MGDAWSEFRREVFGEPYLVWHDGADVGALVAEHEHRPERAERMLRAGVADHDHVAVESLGALARLGRAPSDAAALLRSALPSARGVFRVRTAQVLCQLTGTDEYVSEVAAVLEGCEHWGERIDAAIALPELPITPRSVAALHRGMLDPEYLVRYHSGNGLLGLAGQGSDISADGRFAQVSGKDAAAWRAVADELLGAFATRTAGVYGDRASFAVELGPADYAAPHRRAARVYLAGTRLPGADRPHVPTLRNIGVYTDRPPHYPNLRTTLEHLGFTELPESVTLDEDETAATLAAVTTALDFDIDVSRWCATDLLIGDRSRLALEIGPADPDGPQLRTCTLWLDGANATRFDNTVYVPQFANSLRANAARCRSRRLQDFAQWGATTDDLAAELHPDGTLQYRLISRIDGVGDREGAVRLRVRDVVAVLEKAADVLTAGT
ncbi:type II toxin-antitoxin system VapC family toxin [Lentzea sp. NEAU-D13]|uniref:Type II toxin-antitoxin system VapC family toxin n=1 Tax=Lentzea alba TaxID=2714351 RepID=A0A7C9RTG3_9PSEU|nr:type II toxin-antitoxin system VapC family toxin [Lentzea alba]NGY62510.1 type II toxin-antitoxin system VapC family toxin [Lentzea alba]